MNEQQLIAGCKGQDREAQRILYEQYARVMFGICLRYSSDQDSAKDLLQDGFIKIFANIQSFQGKGSFEGWMKRVFINIALENIRKKKSLIQTSEDTKDLPEMVDADTEDDALYNISENDLLKMIQELPKGYSAVFNLYAIENLSHREIASMLNISEGTSRSQYVRARQLLQSKVQTFIKKNS